MSIPWVSAARTAAAKPLGMGSWRPMRWTWDNPGTTKLSFDGNQVKVYTNPTSRKTFSYAGSVHCPLEGEKTRKCFVRY